MPKTRLNISNEALHICTESVRQLSVSTDSKLLRFNNGSRGISLTFEKPRSDDKIVRHKGQAVLALPKEFYGLFSGMTLDVNEQGCFVLS